MLNRFLKTLGWFVLTLALQVLIFDHVHILGHATPFVAVYFVMLFNGESNRSEILLWSSAIGIIADTFTNTPGVATLSLTTLAMIQPWLLKFHSNTEDEDDVPVPSAAKMGWGPYMRYISVGVIIAETIFYLLETFSFFNAIDLLLNTVGSALLTILIIAAIEGVRISNKRAAA